MTTMHKMAAIGVMVCGGALAQQGGPWTNGWRGIRCKNVEIGLSTQQVDHTLKACRQRGLSAEDTDKLLAPVYAAHKEGLPAGNICIKIEEGLAKQVPTDRIEAAAQARLNYLREAGKLVASMRLNGSGRHGMGRGGGRGASRGMGGGGPGGKRGGMTGPPHLVENIGMALESGVPLAVFQEVFKHAGNSRMGRIMPVVEAAETLQLAGLKPEQIQRVLIDFLDRNLNRRGIQRGVDVLLKGMDSGKDFETVYATLWVDKK